MIHDRRDLVVGADGQEIWRVLFAAQDVHRNAAVGKFKLLEGDGDFASLIRRLQKSGQQVEVASFAEGLAGEAREAADRVILLDQSALES